LLCCWNLIGVTILIINACSSGDVIECGGCLIYGTRCDWPKLVLVAKFNCHKRYYQKKVQNLIIPSCLFFIMKSIITIWKLNVDLCYYSKWNVSMENLIWWKSDLFTILLHFDANIGWWYIILHPSFSMHQFNLKICD